MSRKCRRYNSSLLSTIILLLLLKDGCSCNSSSSDGANTADTGTNSGSTGASSGSTGANTGTTGDSTGSINPLSAHSSGNGSRSDNFVECTYDLAAVNNINYSPSFNTASLSVATAFVENMGKACNVIAFLEISPNDVYYIRDSMEYVLQSREMIALVPSIYSKYVRVGFRTTGDCCTKVRITFQGKR